MAGSGLGAGLLMFCVPEGFAENAAANLGVAGARGQEKRQDREHLRQVCLCACAVSSKFGMDRGCTKSMQ